MAAMASKKSNDAMTMTAIAQSGNFLEELETGIIGEVAVEVAAGLLATVPEGAVVAVVLRAFSRIDYAYKYTPKRKYIFKSAIYVRIKVNG